MRMQSCNSFSEQNVKKRPGGKCDTHIIPLPHLARPLARHPRVPPAPTRRATRRATPTQHRHSNAASSAAPPAAHSSMRTMQQCSTQRSSTQQPTWWHSKQPASRTTSTAQSYSDTGTATRTSSSAISNCAENPCSIQHQHLLAHPNAAPAIHTARRACSDVRFLPTSALRRGVRARDHKTKANRKRRKRVCAT